MGLSILNSGHLTRKVFDKLDSSEKLDLMVKLSERYNMSFIKLQTFERYGQHCHTGVFESNGRRFVFVPGDEVTLGWDHFAQGLNEDSQAELDEVMSEYEFDKSPEEFIRPSMSPVRKAIIGPMLVAQELEETSYESIDRGDPRFANEPKFIKKYQEFVDGDSKCLIWHNTIRFERINNDIVISLYQPSSYQQLVKSLQEQGFSLPTADEWAYLCGGGCRTLFAWGDGMDYSMHLKHFSVINAKNNEQESSDDGGQSHSTYDMQKPNFFGLSIGYDPYMRELVLADQCTSCGGDGGCNICGGLGPFLGFLSCSPHGKAEVHESDEVDGDYDFIRPIIRVHI